MRVESTAIPDVLLMETAVFGDERGFFTESFNQRRFDEAVGRHVEFVQDNHSRSNRGVLRGLHFQNPKSQEKLVRVVRGAVFDVVVDLRRASPTFGKWVGAVLSAANHHQLWIPAGMAHGFLVLEDGTDFLYKTTEYWHREHEHCIRWDDPEIGIEWPSAGAPLILSDKDRQGTLLRDSAGLF